MPAKNILYSKTFWVNVLALGATVSGYLPPQYAAIAVPLLNVALRYVTAQPVTVLPSLQ